MRLAHSTLLRTVMDGPFEKKACHLLIFIVFYFSRLRDSHPDVPAAASLRHLAGRIWGESRGEAQSSQVHICTGYRIIKYRTPAFYWTRIKVADPIRLDRICCVGSRKCLFSSVRFFMTERLRNLLKKILSQRIFVKNETSFYQPMKTSYSLI